MRTRIICNVVAFLVGITILVGIALTGTLPKFPPEFLAAQAAAPQVASPACGPAAIKGTFSFDAKGWAPVPPQELLMTPIGTGGPTAATPGGLLPLHAIGHVKFKADGKCDGYIHENVGGALEGPVPFEGEVTDFQAGPHGEGCWAIWKLQDHHYLPIFANEPPHFFKIAIGKDRFEFLTSGGGPGPAVLSGFATKTQW